MGNPRSVFLGAVRLRASRAASQFAQRPRRGRTGHLEFSPFGPRSSPPPPPHEARLHLVSANPLDLVRVPRHPPSCRPVFVLHLLLDRLVGLVLLVEARCVDGTDEGRDGGRGWSCCSVGLPTKRTLRLHTDGLRSSGLGVVASRLSRPPLVMWTVSAWLRRAAFLGSSVSRCVRSRLRVDCACLCCMVCRRCSVTFSLEVVGGHDTGCGRPCSWCSLASRRVAQAQLPTPPITGVLPRW